MEVTSTYEGKIEAALVHLQPFPGLSLLTYMRRAVGLTPRAFLNLKVVEFQSPVLNLSFSLTQHIFIEHLLCA